MICEEKAKMTAKTHRATTKFTNQLHAWPYLTSERRIVPMQVEALVVANERMFCRQNIIPQHGK